MDNRVNPPTVEGSEQHRRPIADDLPESGRIRWGEQITLPRWTVYVQAGLLGLVATTFFIFGMMVGSLTSGSGTGADREFDCRVVGSVVYRVDGDLRADAGAVVLLLPVQKKPDERSPGVLVNPTSFQVLDNAAIDRIYDLGGAVVRADEDGLFDVVVDGNPVEIREYDVLVVSKHKKRSQEATMTKEQTAMIGTFFLPVEDVVGIHTYYSMKFRADTKRVDLPEIEF